MKTWIMILIFAHPLPDSTWYQYIGGYTKEECIAQVDEIRANSSNQNSPYYKEKAFCTTWGTPPMKGN